MQMASSARGRSDDGEQELRGHNLRVSPDGCSDVSAHENGDAALDRTVSLLSSLLRDSADMSQCGWWHGGLHI